MRLAILTDIHANREALVAVLADVALLGCDRIAVLGDVVGYGPDPGWCVDRVQAMVAEGAVCVRGNHDDAVVSGRIGMNLTASRAVHWTRGQLSAGQVAFLSSLPMTERLGEVLLAHACADAPEDWNYVQSAREAGWSFDATDAGLILLGHVHVPLLVSHDGRKAREHRFRAGVPVPLVPANRWLAVVGAVGQPRDGDPAAAYAVHDGTAWTLTFHKVPYDCEATVRKIRAAGLPEILAERLRIGM